METSVDVAACRPVCPGSLIGYMIKKGALLLEDCKRMRRQTQTRHDAHECKTCSTAGNTNQLF